MKYGKLKGRNAVSLLRYPGGKSRGGLHKLIFDKICANYDGGVFAEPFFGGGGISIRLLKQGVIDSLIVCEKDWSLLGLWKTIAHHPNFLTTRVSNFDPSVDAFIHYKDLILNGDSDPFAALVVNRLAHGGRGVKAGPQGGHDQKGKYKIGCRWKPNKIVATIHALHQLFQTVKVEFYNDYHVEADYYYVDPPYWDIGKELYLHNFNDEDHKDLKDFLEGRKFLLSYNNHGKVKELWKGHPMLITGASGNGGSKPDTELLIWS